MNETLLSESSVEKLIKLESKSPNLSLVKLTFGQKIRPYLWLLHYGMGRFGQARSPGIFWWSNQKKNDVISTANGRAE